MSNPPVHRDIAIALKSSGDRRPASCGGRLIAIVVGVDQYSDPAIPDLTCAVNDAESVANAIRQSHPSDRLDLTILTSPIRQDDAAVATEESLLDALRKAAEVAGANDTLVFYFGGHGAILRQRPCLFPADARVIGCDASAIENVVGIDQFQAIFEHSACRRRVMFLDCCQNSFLPAASEPESAEQPLQASRAIQWRTGLPVSGSMIETFASLPQGWSMLLACGPNELSLEDPEWGQHGVFSHFLASGLRGQADLDDDGIVSLAELSQFLADRVPKQARAILDEVSRRGLPCGSQSDQTPTLVWEGPIVFPLTQSVHEGREGFQRRLFPTWLRFLYKSLPYPLAVEAMVRYGTALLYGLAMVLSVMLFLVQSGRAVSPMAGAVIGAVSAAVWIAALALAGASNAIRWHRGGYVAPCLALAWQTLVFATFAFRVPPTGNFQSLWAVFRFGVDQVILTFLIVIFGFNALQNAIVLADLVKRDERVVLRRAFADLERRWVHAELPNVLAMVSGHPHLYQIVGLGFSCLFAAHAAYLLAMVPFGAAMAIDLLRDAILIVLIQWQAQWYSATYSMLRRTILPSS